MKNKLLLILLLFSCLTFSGCSRKKNEVEKGYSKRVSNIVFQQLLYRRYSKCTLKNPEQFYLSQKFYDLMLSPAVHFESEDCANKITKVYLFEKYNPAFTGLFDCLDIYDCSSDNGDWVDTAIDQGELARLSEQLEKLIEDSDGDYGIFSEKEKELQQQAEEIRYLNEDLRLKVMKYGEEYFVPQKVGDNLIFINTDKDGTTRNVYDKEFRLIKTEKWVINQEKIVRLGVESYEYAPDSVQIVSKSVIGDGIEENYYYNDDYLLTRYEKFDTSKSYQRKLVQKQSWTFDDDKNLIYEGEIELKDGATFEKETKYSYNASKINPDSEYYENGSLKIKTVYSSDSDYETVIYFDEDFSVRTIYEKNKKVKDLYYVGDIFLREQNYE